MKDFLDLEIERAEKAWRRHRWIILALLGLILFGMGTCVGVKVAMDAPTVTKSDTVHVNVAGSTSAYKPVPTSITYDDTASFTECFPIATAPKPKSIVPTTSGPTLWDVLAAAAKPRDSIRWRKLSAADSMAIVDAYLRDYSARVTYSETLRIDTAGITGTVTKDDTLRFNRIQSTSWRYSLNVPVVTNTIAPAPRKPKKWGIGLQLGYGFSYGQDKPQPFIGVGLSRNLIRF